MFCHLQSLLCITENNIHKVDNARKFLYYFDAYSCAELSVAGLP